MFILIIFPHEIAKGKWPSRSFERQDPKNVAHLADLKGAQALTFQGHGTPWDELENGRIC